MTVVAERGLRNRAPVTAENRPARTGIAGILYRLPIHGVLLAVSVVWMIPIVGLLVSSVRPAAAVSTTGWWTAFAQPGDFTLSNYIRVGQRNGIWLSVMNSFAITIPATIATVALAAVAAYGFARLTFTLRTTLLMMMVVLLAVPQQITFVPLLRLMNATDQAGSFTGIWFLHVGYNLPFAIYLLANAFLALPKEMFEAATIDGANHTQIFLRIVAPVSRPLLASVTVFTFVWIWNDLLTALIFLGGDKDVAPVTVAVSNMVASRGEGWQILTSAAVVSTVIPIVVFLTAQRQFVDGLLAGSTKG